MKHIEEEKITSNAVTMSLHILDLMLEVTGDLPLKVKAEFTGKVHKIIDTYGLRESSEGYQKGYERGRGYGGCSSF